MSYHIHKIYFLMNILKYESVYTMSVYIIYSWLDMYLVGNILLLSVLYIHFDDS